MSSSQTTAASNKALTAAFADHLVAQNATPAWWQQMKKKAFDLYRALPMPTRKQEQWRFASLNTLVASPWFLSWGSTDTDRARILPGDEIVPFARGTTRAVMIAALADEVWPWVVQLGPDRAGYYSYEILEDLAGCRMLRATEILPGAQECRPGDRL